VWASAELSSQQLLPAPTLPSIPTQNGHERSTPAGTHDAPTQTHTGTTHTGTTHSTPATDPDTAYRDLLTRVREEREQVGQLISHPF
jgi:hypothetical protein